MTTTYEQTLRKDTHTRRFAIRTDEQGWRVETRADSTVIRTAVYTDWHKVERARRAFAIEVSSLRKEGWN
jgi:hypothetical protein